ncbi:MAG: CopG family antitoxin [Bacillota bacterium]
MANKLPDFKNHEEEAEFWATANTLDYIDETEEIDVTLDPALQKKMRPVTIRLRNTQIDALKAIAARKDIPYQTMVRSWITEKLQEELGIKPSRKGPSMKKVTKKV